MYCSCKGFYVNPTCPQHGRTPVIDLERAAWEQIKQAASESEWIPKEYFMNDWLSDVCEFLRKGNKK